MELIQIAGYLLVIILCFIPLFHVVRSQYWSSDAKIIWGIAVLFTYLLGYVIFLIATLVKSRKQDTHNENSASNWIYWFLILVGNGIVGYLWIVFGLAAAASPDSAAAMSLIIGAEWGVTIPLFFSIYFMSTRKYYWGLACNASVLPMIFVFTILVDFIKPS